MLPHPPCANGPDGAADTPSPRAASYSLAAVLAVAVVVRVLLMALLPLNATSIDAASWVTVAGHLEQQHNPYVETIFLNWPPFWLVVLAGLNQLAHRLDLTLVAMLQILFSVMDLVMIVALHRLLHRDGHPRAAWLVPLLGIALNPVCLALSLMHLNFDVFVALWLLLAAWWLRRWLVQQDPLAWLWAAACIGLGIATKTVPLLAAGMLAINARQLRRSVLLLGALLVLGPVACSLLPLYALTPAAITEHVLAYRSFGGYYGISGLLQWLDWNQARGTTARAFMPLMLALLGGLILWFGRERRARRYDPLLPVLGCSAMLLLVPTLGPGYAPQYFWWAWPLLLWLAVAAPPLRGVVVTYGLVAALTYLVEYALIPSQGAFLRQGVARPLFIAWGDAICRGAGQAILRLPLFIAALVLVGTLIAMFVRRARGTPAGV